MSLSESGLSTILVPRKDIHVANRSFCFVISTARIQTTSNKAKFFFHLRGRIPHTEVYRLMCDMSPPVGFGRKCPKFIAYKVFVSQFSQSRYNSLILILAVEISI